MLENHEVQISKKKEVIEYSISLNGKVQIVINEQLSGIQPSHCTSGPFLRSNLILAIKIEKTFKM